MRTGTYTVLKNGKSNYTIAYWLDETNYQTNDGICDYFWWKTKAEAQKACNAYNAFEKKYGYYYDSLENITNELYEKMANADDDITQDTAELHKLFCTVDEVDESYYYDCRFKVQYNCNNYEIVRFDSEYDLWVNSKLTEMYKWSTKAEAQKACDAYNNYVENHDSQYEPLFDIATCNISEQRYENMLASGLFDEAELHKLFNTVEF